MKSGRVNLAFPPQQNGFTNDLNGKTTRNVVFDARNPFGSHQPGVVVKTTEFAAQAFHDLPALKEWLDKEGIRSRSGTTEAMVVGLKGKLNAGQEAANAFLAELKSKASDYVEDLAILQIAEFGERTEIVLDGPIIVKKGTQIGKCTVDSLRYTHKFLMTATLIMPTPRPQKVLKGLMRLWKLEPLLWAADGRVVRWVFYGKPDLLKGKPTDLHVISREEDGSRVTARIGNVIYEDEGKNCDGCGGHKHFRKECDRRPTSTTRRFTRSCSSWAPASQRNN